MKPLTTCALVGGMQAAAIFAMAYYDDPTVILEPVFAIVALIEWLFCGLFCGLAIWLAASDSNGKPEPTGGQVSYPNPPPRKLYPNQTPRHPDL